MHTEKSDTRSARRFAPVLFMMAFGFSTAAQAALITRNVNVTLNAASIETFDLDVDLNGTVDFTFSAGLVSDPLLTVAIDAVDFPFGSNNGVVIDRLTADGFPTASRLGSGATVSSANIFSSASFDQANLFFSTSFDPPSGNFGGRTGFLGLRFDRAGDTVFGFAEVTVNALTAPVNPSGLTIGRVGFNNVAGQAVTINAVPEPAMLALLGIGGFGLFGARRRK